MQSLFGGFFGGGPQDGESSTLTRPNNSANSGIVGSSGGSGRAYTFNFPGGGQGRVVFGSFNGQIGGNPFGPMNGDHQGGLESYVSSIHGS